MVSEFNDVNVTGMDVKKDSKTKLSLWGGGPDVGWYNITNNHDSAFNGMVNVFTAAAMLGNKKVTVVFGGSFSGSPPTDKEIEQVIMLG